MLPGKGQAVSVNVLAQPALTTRADATKHSIHIIGSREESGMHTTLIPRMPTDLTECTIVRSCAFPAMSPLGVTDALSEYC